MDRKPSALLFALGLALMTPAAAEAPTTEPPPAEAAPPDAARDPLGDYLDQVRAQRRAQYDRLRAESRSESERARREQREAADEHWRAHREQAEQRRDGVPPVPAYPPGWGNPWYFQGW